MPTYLLASSPIHGHVGPMLQVAGALADRGHDVTLLTGTRFQAQVEARGVAFAPLDGRADFDDRDPDSVLPDRHRYSGVRRAQYDIRTLFIETVPDQHRGLSVLVDRLRPDAVLVDNAFGGAVPLARADGIRPVVAALGVTPLSQSDVGLAPYGLGLPPARGAFERAKYRAMGAVASRVLFREVQRRAEEVYGRTGLVLDFPVMDGARQYDLFFQSGPRGLDYPRPHLWSNVRYVGVVPQAAASAPRPHWWHELDATRPVVHVTQGTIDNRDFGRLVRPTLDALAGERVQVVVSAGGRPVEEVGALPSNARVAEYLRYDELLPLTSVFVTNAGFGGVQAALAHGVPMVLAGGTEDKPEVTARVAWAGAGVDLHTGTPTPEQVRAAVRSVLDEPSYRAAAGRLRGEIAGLDAIDLIERGLAEAARAR